MTSEQKDAIDKPIAIVLSEGTTHTAKCQLLQEGESDRIREGMFLKINSAGKRVLAYISSITPYNDFYTVGDAWSEARRKQFPIPEEVARQYVICELEILGTLPGLKNLSYPVKSGDKVYTIDVSKDQKEIFNIGPSEKGYLWYGTLYGYPNAPIPLNVENIPMHIALFGTTGSGKSHSMGSLIEKLVRIPVNSSTEVSLPMLIIDANGDYLDYVEYAAKNGSFGTCPSVIRFVFPNSPIRGLAKKNVKPFGIDLNQLTKRELAELIIQFYSGGELNELQVSGIERLLDEMESLHDIEENDFQKIFERDDIFRRTLSRLQSLEDEKTIHSGTSTAIRRAFMKFRELEQEHRLLSGPYKLSEDFVDNLTKNREIAVIDFSADGSPGVSLQLKQIVVSYFAALLFKKFMQYKINKKTRYMMFAIEECQNYIPNISNYNVGSSLAREKLSLIATQGRKFGIGLCLISQRPSFVDPVVLSMCNTFFIHRISPEDQSFVEKVSGGLPPHIRKRLTTLEKGSCIVVGQMNDRLTFPILLSIPKKEIDHSAGTTNVLDDVVRASNE